MDYEKLKEAKAEYQKFDEEFKKKIFIGYDDFKKKYDIKLFKSLDGEELLKKMFLGASEKDNLCHALEYSANYKVYGGISGEYAKKYELRYCDGSWVRSQNNNSQRISTEAAIKRGKEIRELIENVCKYISLLKFESIDDYRKLGDFISKLSRDDCKLAKQKWFRKYLHMIFPEHFPAWYKETILEAIIRYYGEIPEGGLYAKMGQVALISKACGLPLGIFANLETNKKVVEEVREQTKGNENMTKDDKIFENDLNIILYGPPGTGKTYNTVVEAMKIIAPEKYKEYEAGNDYGVLKAAFDEYRKQNRIEFVTFHQSFSYEEFVEGIKPVIDDESEDTDRLGYRIEDGIFKRICENAETPIIHENNNIGLNKEPKIWKISLKGTGDNEIRKYCMEHDCIRIGYYEDSQEGKGIFHDFADEMNVGDIVISCFSQKTFDAIGVVTGEYYENKELKDYRSVREVKWLVKGVNKDILAINNNKILVQRTVYRLKSVSVEDVLNIINNSNSKEKVSYEENNQPYVLIIDEINRGNISKIFGELITLIEPDKRIGAEHELRVSLPYTKDKLFGVPKNLYIIGTMNTSDRSIASIDIALRRRFKFKEMMPRDDLVADFGIGFGDIFKDLNLKIKLLLDRDHQIGHSYFMNPKNNNVTELKRIWFDRIIPLLNEYFYCDWEKLELIIPGFIKPVEIPEILRKECEDNCYEFKTMEEFDDTGFIEALKSEKDEKKSS